MRRETTYSFEILVIDKNGQTNITTDESLMHGLLFSESLWSKKQIIEKNGAKIIIDEELDLELQFQTVDTSSALNDLIESAFIVRVLGNNFEKIEAFRIDLLIHLRKKLSFTNIRILRDDVSTKISNDIYPLINRVENLLRRYLVKFFTQKIGVDWWEITAPRTLIDKINLRKGNEKIFSTLVDTDVTLIDFNDLGELIYKQTTGFNTQENIIDRVMRSESIEDLSHLKQELQGNYTKYFKEAFQKNNFDKKWKDLFEIRNKVAHNNLFVQKDLNLSMQLVEELTKVINDAESKIDEFKFSIEEQEALRQATIEAVKEAEIQNETRENPFGLKVIGNIDLSNYEFDRESQHPFKIITQEELIQELQLAEKTLRDNNLRYVGLKAFVKKILGSKGYSYGPTYSLVNILRDKEMIEIYDVNDESSSWPVKAVRVSRSK